MIRFARPDDSVAILEIYDAYIETPITFECELPTESEFSKRMADISAFYPCLVCEEEGKVIGFAYAHRHITSKGLGKKLYAILIEILKLQGVRTVYGGVTVPNEKSESLHKAMGFSVAGTYHHAGFKDGKWRDVTWFEKAIAPYDSYPEPVVSIGSIPKQELLEIISSFR